MDRQETDRPQVMWDLTETQLSEMQNQFDEGDRMGFNWRAESFGWPPEQGNEVWSWFEAGNRAVEQIKSTGAIS